MVHCNNCTSDLNAWVNLFKEFAESLRHGSGYEQTVRHPVQQGIGRRQRLRRPAGIQLLLQENILQDLKRDVRCSSRTPDSKFSLANFMRTHLYTSLERLKDRSGYPAERRSTWRWIGSLDTAALFKTKGVGQKILAAATGCAGSCYGDSRRRRSMGNCPSGTRTWSKRVKARHWMQYLNEKVFGRHDTVKRWIRFRKM